MPLSRNFVYEIADPVMSNNEVPCICAAYGVIAIGIYKVVHATRTGSPGVTNRNA